MNIYGNSDIWGDLLIRGSFSVLGSASSIETESLVVSDTIIALGHSQSGPILDEGIMFIRGTGLTQAIIWDESDDTFALVGTNDDHTIVGDVNIDSYSNLRVGGLTTSTFKMSSGASNGYFLQSDASGNANWSFISGGLTGSGLINYVPYWTNSNTLSSTSSIYFDSNFVGIGTTSPSYKLEVSGTVSTTGFRMSSGASNGYFLQSDASGNATWGSISGGLTGSGTTNYVSKWSSVGTLTNSLIYDNGTVLGINGWSSQNTFGVYTTNELVSLLISNTSTTQTSKKGVSIGVSTPGSSTANYGAYITVQDSANFNYGVYTSVQGSSGSTNYGYYTTNNSQSSNEKYGSYNGVTGDNLSLSNYGIQNSVSGASNYNIGSRNIITGTYGYRQSQVNILGNYAAYSGDSNNVNFISSNIYNIYRLDNVYNTNSGSASIKSNIINQIYSGTSDYNYGVQNLISIANVANYGVYNTISGTAGQKFGVYNSIGGDSSQNKYGNYNSISGDGPKFGVYNTITGTSSDTKIGNYTLIQGNSNLSYGSFYNIYGTGSTNYGIYIDSYNATTNYGIFVNRGMSIFNGSGDTVSDFQIKGDTDNNLLYADVSSNSIGVGTNTPDSTAILQLSSTTKGFLPPRMTAAQAELISSPAEGLLVYSTDGLGVTITSKGWWGYTGATWTKLN